MMKAFFTRGFLPIAICSLLASCSEKNAQTSDQQSASMMDSFVKSDKSLSLDEYMRWVEDKENGLKVEKKIGEMTYMAQYKPYDYLSVLELKNETIDDKRLKEKIKNYEGMQYFTFRITAEDQQQELLRKNIASDQEYYSRIEYFSFNMQKDFKLIDGKDTLDCELYHYERVYGLAPYATFVLGFPLTKDEEKNNRSHRDKTIGYTDHVFGSGNIYMTIKGEDLSRVPELKL